MNVRLFGLAAAMTMAMGVVACGDDTGGEGGAGGGSTSSGTDTTTSSSTGNNNTTSSGGEGGDDTTTSSSSGEGGNPGEGGAGGGGEGGAPPSDAPCADECADEPACAADEGVLEVPDDSACGECVAAEAAQGAESQCIITAAFEPECQDFQECADFVTCGLSEETEVCIGEFPEGYAIFTEVVYLFCAECGDGAI